MGDGAGLGRRRSLLLVLLLMLSLISTTQAQGGAVLIDETSFSLTNGTTVDVEDVGATLELSEVLGSSANVSIVLSVQTLEGEEVSNQTQALSLIHI